MSPWPWEDTDFYGDREYIKVMLLKVATDCFLHLKERTKTAALYLDFCLSAIHAIQATVEHLSEREQIRAQDRPYTNGYFVDIIDQIKQNVQQTQAGVAAVDKEGKKEKLRGIDPESYVFPDSSNKQAKSFAAYFQTFIVR